MKDKASDQLKIACFYVKIEKVLNERKNKKYRGKHIWSTYTQL